MECKCKLKLVFKWEIVGHHAKQNLMDEFVPLLRQNKKTNIFEKYLKIGK